MQEWEQQVNDLLDRIEEEELDQSECSFELTSLTYEIIKTDLEDQDKIQLLKKLYGIKLSDDKL